MSFVELVCINCGEKAEDDVWEIFPLNVPVVAAIVLGVVAPTVPLMLIELTPVNVLFNPRIDAPVMPCNP